MPDSNYDTIRYGTKDGELKFGHIQEDGKISSFLVRSGFDANHYFMMDTEGEPHRKNGTIHRCTGAFQVRAGDNVLSGGKEENIAIWLEAVTGDIVLNAHNGSVRIIADNIQIESKGNDPKGNINIKAKEKITLDSRVINVSGSASVKIFSDRQIDIVGKTFLNIFGGLIDCADAASTKKGSKPDDTTNEKQNK